jgi:hypothetical protein
MAFFGHFYGMDSEPALPPAIIFSDSAKRDPVTGKLTLAGVFQRFKSSCIPFTSPAFFATVFVTNIRGKIESLPVTMEIEDSSGIVLSTATGEIGAAARVRRHDVSEIAFPIPPTVFVAAGQYKAVVLVDGERVGYRVFNVTT